MLMTNLKHINSVDEYKKFIEENENVMICCGRMGPMCLPVYDIMEDLEEEYKNVKFMKTRIDKPLEFDEKFDDVFISFVLHGFPHDVRETIIKNAYNSLKSEGRFLIVDFAEFSLEKMPIYYRIPFQTIECKFAFDFIKRDWKQILSEFGFGKFSEKHYFKNYVRLLEAIKIG